MLNIENKFDIGQEVYVIWKVKVKVPCSVCKGDGHKIIDGHKYYCSLCCGEGFFSYRTNKEYQVIGLKTVTLVKTITQTQGTIVTYNVESEDGKLKEVPEHHLFTDGEEAIKYCELLNKKKVEE